MLATPAERARGAGRPQDHVVALFAVLIEASKDIQRAAPPIEFPVDLDTLRGVLSELDELAAAPNLNPPARERLRLDIEALRCPGLTDVRRQEIFEAAQLQ